MADSDLAEVAARFGAELRLAGLPVGPGRSERFANAVTIARPQTLDADAAQRTAGAVLKYAEDLQAVRETGFEVLAAESHG